MSKFRSAYSGQISIHALREEGDGQHGSTLCNHHISIHALREEGDKESNRSNGG